MRWSALSSFCARRLWGAGPLLLLLVNLVEGLSHYVVLVPVDGRTAHNVLGLGYRGKLGRIRVFVGARRVLARVGTAGAVAMAEAGQCGRECIMIRVRLLGALLLQRACECLGIGDGGGLELLESLEVALALLALQLQQRYGGAQGNGIGVVRL